MLIRTLPDVVICQSLVSPTLFQRRLQLHPIVFAFKLASDDITLVTSIQRRFRRIVRIQLTKGHHSLHFEAHFYHRGGKICFLHKNLYLKLCVFPSKNAVGIISESAIDLYFCSNFLRTRYKTIAKVAILFQSVQEKATKSTENQDFR